MNIFAMQIPVRGNVTIPFELGEWTACETKDYTMFAAVEKMYIDLEVGDIRIFGKWGHTNLMGEGEAGWVYAGQCRRATEREKELEERRRVFAKKGRKNNEFHPFDAANDGHYAMTVMYQDKETGIVTVAVNNTDKSFRIKAENLELVYAAEDMCG
ncbi:hypothetical protein BAMA_16215 [Bacillus manliponensis]|uniref:Uncharacterized protein n=1 Tax=Bacillus manliponensis TaxID=574376 RepID=A0A073JSK4_9BACI|nr:hypothetical protein [Bacillus manliponensis]KEK17237.1 hypothetical protein BAMA_16215 [Bacillus manliponensis]